MTERPDTHPRKAPTQARSIATVEAMVEATARILVAEGPEACTTNRIAEVAGVSIGSLYQYFPSREALLAALVERELEVDMAFGADLMVSQMHRPLCEAWGHVVEALVAYCAEPPRQRLHQRLLPLVPWLEREGLVRSTVGQSQAAFAAFVELRCDELGPTLRGDDDASAARRRVAAFVAFESLEATLNAAKVRHPEHFNGAELVASLKRLLSVLTG